MKKILAGILVLLVVAGVSYNFGHKAGLREIDIDQGENKAKEELVELTRRDFEEYQKLKTLEERYQKADEILGKVVTLFLADLGLRLGYKPIPSSDLGTSCSPAPAAPCPPSSAPAVVTAPPSVSPPRKQTPRWMNEERRLLNETSEADARRDLKKMQIPDLFAAIQTAQPVGMQDAQAINGRFSGEILFSDRKDHKSDWLIEWEVNLRPGATPLGSTSIVLTNKADGKVISRTRGDRPGKDFMKIPGSRGLIVNVYGDDGYIQIYPFEDGNTWLGNYYEKVKLGSYKMSGQVSLHRVN